MAQLRNNGIFNSAPDKMRKRVFAHTYRYSLTMHSFCFTCVQTCITATTRQSTDVGVQQTIRGYPHNRPNFVISRHQCCYWYYFTAKYILEHRTEKIDKKPDFKHFCIVFTRAHAAMNRSTIPLSAAEVLDQMMHDLYIHISLKCWTR